MPKTEFLTREVFLIYEFPAHYVHFIMGRGISAQKFAAFTLPARLAIINRLCFNVT